MQALYKQALADLLAIRIHDNYRAIWYETYPELVEAIVHAGLNNLSMHFGVQNNEPNSVVRRGVLNYKNPDSPTGYTNLFDYPATIPSGEFHNFEITTDMLNRDMEFTFTWLKPSPNNPRVWHVEGDYSFIVKYYNPNPPPDNGNGDEMYPTQGECEAAGYFWYDDACHMFPKAPGEIPWLYIGVGIAVVALAGVAGYLALKGR